MCALQDADGRHSVMDQLEQTLRNSAIKSTIIKLVGLVLTILGLIVFALPLPLGIPLTAIGLMMLISSSRTARRVVRYLRIKSSMVDRLFTLVETKVPGPTQAVLRKTRRRTVGRRAHHPAPGP